MFFPKQLKQPIDVNVFVDTLNPEITELGTLQVVKTDVPLAPIWVVLAPYDDARFVVTVACVYEKFGSKVNCVKAQVNDLSSIGDYLVNNAVGNAVARAGGTVGSLVFDIASGASAKRKRAKAMAKIFNKEIVTVLARLGW